MMGTYSSLMVRQDLHEDVGGSAQTLIPGPAEDGFRATRTGGNS